MSTKKSNISAIVVLYYPDHNNLNDLINKILPSIALLVLIDNTPKIENQHLNNIASKNDSNIVYIPLKANKGIAEAQNIGIERVLQESYIDYIIFFDQDSNPNGELITLLKESFLELKKSGLKTAAVVPVKVNKQTKKPYKARYTNNINYLSKYSIRRVASNSGMLVSIEALKEIGLMESELFIDYVDYEWCWRANSKSYKIIAIKNLYMEHQFGEGDKKIFFINFKTSKPFRTYYQYKNSIKMLKRTYVPISFKCQCIIDNIIKFFVYTIFIPPRFTYLKYMTSGIIDGILNRKNNQ